MFYPCFVLHLLEQVRDFPHITLEMHPGFTKLYRVIGPLNGKSSATATFPKTLSFPDVLRWSSLKSEGRLGDFAFQETQEKRKQNDNLKGEACCFLHNVLEYNTTSIQYSRPCATNYYPRGITNETMSVES